MLFNLMDTDIVSIARVIVTIAMTLNFSQQEISTKILLQINAVPSNRIATQSTMQIPHS